MRKAEEIPPPVVFACKGKFTDAELEKAIFALDWMKDYAKELLEDDQSGASDLMRGQVMLRRLVGDSERETPDKASNPTEKRKKRLPQVGKIKHVYDARGFCQLNHDGQGICGLERQRKPRKGSAIESQQPAADTRTVPMFPDPTVATVGVDDAKA